MYRKILLLLIIILLMLGCYEENKIKEMTVAKRFEKAKEMFEDEDYYNAKLNFEMITLTARGHTIIDSAQYLLAYSHYNMDEFVSAASEFKRLISDFPTSQLTDDAQYMVGMSYYRLSPKYSLDQNYTKKAITEFNTLLEYYPDSEYIDEAKKHLEICRNKLAKKEYKIGEQYMNLKNYQSAIIYFDSVLDNFPGSKFEKQAVFKKGKAYYELEKYREAKLIFEEFLNMYSENEYTEKAKDYLKKINSEKLSNNNEG